MLLELSIRNFAIIEETSIQFSEGLNVLTGETGAGKSILLDALGAVLGARATSDVVRTGESSARIEAVFAPDAPTIERLKPILVDLGIEADDEVVILTREIMANGRSTARLNGRMATARALASVGELLVDIHGQSDHLAILRTSEQRVLLDRFAATEQLRLDVGRLWREWRTLQNRLHSLTHDARDREQRADLLRFQVTEIEEAAFAIGDEERLIAERDVLRNADRLRTDAVGAQTLLESDDIGDTVSASAILRQVVSQVEDLASLDRQSAGLAERANDLLVLAEDLARDLRDYAESVEPDEGRLAELEDRLDLLQSLKRKYGATVDDILAFAQEAQAELDRLMSAEFDADALEAAVHTAAARLAREARELSERRQVAATRLAAEIETSVSELHMGRADLAIAVERRESPDGIDLDGARVHVDETGIDHVEFLLAPNAGETLRPLARIASGGEMARLMLAIKSILSDVDLTPTLVFDEIDVGVGGRIGQVVGEKLWSISERHQVIVITHLPQIAAFGTRHLRIEKDETPGGRTVSTVRQLDMVGREVELAAMIDGLPPGEAALLNAHTMLERSQAFVAASSNRRR